MLSLARFFLGRCRRGLLCCLSIALILLPSSVLALGVATPFSVNNSSPFVLIYGLPDIGRAFLLDKGQGQVELAFQVTNNFLNQYTATESLRLDGEIDRYRLRWAFAPLDTLELGVEVSYLQHNGGFMDAPIDNFHQNFGFSRGHRADIPKNQLSYSYRSGSQMPFDFNSSDDGLGDSRLSAAWQLLRQSDTALALRCSLKLPTGDSEQLTSSGGTDFALWLAGAQIFSTSIGPVSLYGSVGGLWLGDTDILSELQRRLVAFGGLGTGWSPLPWLKLQLQVDVHSGFYQDTEINALAGETTTLTFGSVFGLGPNQELELAMVEDIVPETAPDVALHLAWRYRY